MNAQRDLIEALAVDKDGMPRPIVENAKFAAEADFLGRLAIEIAGLDQRIRAAQAAKFLESERAAGRAIGGDAALEAARRLLDGETIGTDPEDIAALQRRRETLAEARTRQSEIVERLRGELSAQACTARRAVHRKAMADLLSAARALARAAAAEQAVRIELLNRGFVISETIMPAPALAAAVMIGNEGESTSPLATFKQQLASLGVTT